MAKVDNFYSELPEIPFERTSVDMKKVIDYAKSLSPEFEIDFIKSAYAIFRNESSNGMKGVNNNYAGIQADNARWTDLPGNPIGTCVKIDSGGDNRRFLCFTAEDGYKICFKLLCIKCKSRGIVDGITYYRKWVGRSFDPTLQEQKNFNSMRSQLSL